MSLYSEKATKINIVHWSKFLFVGLLLSISLTVNAQQDDQPANSTVAEQLQQLRKEVVALR